MRILEKMISNEGRILNTIKSITEYDIPTVSDTILRAKTEMTTEGPDNNLTIILKNRILSSELSNILKDFKNMIVDNDDDVKKPQLKKRKRNKYYYTEDITHGF